MFPDVGGVQLNGQYTVIFDDRAGERILQQKEPEPGIPQWSIWLNIQLTNASKCLSFDKLDTSRSLPFEMDRCLRKVSLSRGRQFSELFYE
jgi:hypothetical protein